MTALRLIHSLAPVATLLPLAAFVGLGLLRIAGLRPNQRQLAVLVKSVFAITAFAAFALAAAMLIAAESSVVVSLGRWFSAGERAFEITLLLDWLSIPFLVMSALLCGTVAAFTTRYLHREPGEYRFAALLLLFSGGIQLVTTAGSLDVAYIGWELVGLTSALLIAFFHEREAPVHHGLWAYGTYRTSDVALLLAAMVAHVAIGDTDYARMYGGLSGGSATLVAFLLVFATMGKSAMVPLSGWLPRAMEGPTPSSAIFYGALSVHAGCYVLLRAGPLLDRQPLACGALIVIGLSTALYATLVGRAQTDIKTALAYATLTQLGLIFAEIGAGLHTLALIHIIGHAFLRSLQFLRSPSLLHERHQVEAAMGEHVTRTGAHLERIVPERHRSWLYRFALNRGYLDGVILGRVIAPLSRMFRRFDRWERAFTERLGAATRSGTRP